MLITRHFAHFTADSLRVRENAKIPHADLFVKQWRYVGGSNLAVKRSVRERGRVYRCDLQNLLPLQTFSCTCFIAKPTLLPLAQTEHLLALMSSLRQKLAPYSLKTSPCPLLSTRLPPSYIFELLRMLPIPNQ